MDAYIPINCGFHDELEAWSVLRQPCRILYRNADDAVVDVTDHIVDIYAQDKADFLKLKKGTVIRLDRLISVNGKPLPTQELNG
ncbi:MAG: hypothetical protein AAGA75_23190 [Cyanobacteria bacterium P01_E01_bin.6]